ncbi:hypothetical protein CBP31_01500 [Oceanisphaera profunda]|uniref:Uncharacterized protein n=1 Tax=Oceanisphaera profunda TaxID=1416627 RepID=A0A1Y0D1S7_9GAMM|nr:hypothetical protein [Oceanisphaera profunda]ART81471.1 hypothetical protein CBP31_01500 [Oceanisphaera profunda]
MLGAVFKSIQLRWPGEQVAGYKYDIFRGCLFGEEDFATVLLGVVFKTTQLRRGLEFGDPQ